MSDSNEIVIAAIATALVDDVEAEDVDVVEDFKINDERFLNEAKEVAESKEYTSVVMSFKNINKKLFNRELYLDKFLTKKLKTMKV